MRYLQSYALYEDQDSSPSLLGAMKHTPEGKDLSALATDYRVDRTGKLVISGLRGKTFVQPQADGTWNHWVLATGRTYGEGSHPTLEECLRSVWRDYVLKSTAFRPKGMPIKEYEGRVEPELPTLEGKALDKESLTLEIDKILSPFPNPILRADEFLNHPKWKPVLKLLGENSDFTTTRDHSWNYYLFSRDSVFVKLFLGEASENLETYFFQVKIQVHVIIFEAISKFSSQPEASLLSAVIGGDRADLPSLADKFWGEHLPSLFPKLTDQYSFKHNPRPKETVEMFEAAAQVLKSFAAHGNLGEIEDLLLELIRNKDYSFRDASYLSREVPGLWKKFVAAKGDDDYYQHAGILGDLGF